MKPIHLFLALASASAGFVGTAGTGCQIQDADLANGAVTEFKLTPAATTVDRFSMHYTGTVTAGFTSAQPATLTINVGGQPVLTQSIDLSTQLTQPIDVTVPLLAEGPNAVTATLTYQGGTQSADSLITVAITAPTVTIPTLTQTYTAHVGVNATGKIAVTAATGYKVDWVQISEDSGPWLPAISDGSGGWDATYVNPDIGPVDFAARAQVSIDGHSAVLTTHAMQTVNPVFDCAASTSMLPSSQIDTNSGNNNGNGGVNSVNRVLIGYFGRPGRHDASFVISGQGWVNNGNTPTALTVTYVSQTVTLGPTEAHVSIPVGGIRCTPNNNQTPNTTCDTAYNLAAVIDGVQVCATTGTGQGPAGYFGVYRQYF